MANQDPRVDDYIANSAPFAQPILRHLRQLVHRACPEVEETLKWNVPHFMHRGVLCSMAAFKAHCSFGFWQGRLVLGRGPGGEAGEGMGHFGRVTSVADLPADAVLMRYVRKAAELNEAGIKAPKKPATRTGRTVRVPPDLAAGLKANAQARATFEKLSPSHRREYVDWITEGKREETRRRRVQTTLAWLAEGKPRNWKDARC